MKRPPTVAIMGLGLVGGSLARALSRAGWRVIGVDRAAVLRRATAARVIRSGSLRVEIAAEQADIVVLAAPPEANLLLLKRLSASGFRGVITDVGSVKGPICREAKHLGMTSFIGGHPMAGTEGSGFGASTPELFRGRPWILTPPSSASAVRKVRALARAAGGRLVTMSAADHDRAVAFLSHGPQLASWAILEALQQDPVARRHRGIAGPGFRDMTRLAASPRRLWRAILAQNRTEVVRALRALSRSLARAASTLSL